MRPLVWFRSDLRADDNAALSAASRAADRGVVGVFTLCPQQWQAHDWADVKVEFLLRSLACLSERLKKLRIPLRIVETSTFAEVPAALLALARQHHCDALYCNREYEVNESRRDATSFQMFEQAGLAVHRFDDTVIIPPDMLRTADGRFYTVFTPFKRAWLARFEEDAIDTLPVRPRAQHEWVCSPDTVPERVAGFDLDRGLPDLWPTGEGVALKRLAEFVTQRIASYKQLRDHPADDGTSRLSPYLAHGVLSPRRCLVEARDANAGWLDGGRAGPATWVSELIWREFYRHVLVGFPRVSKSRAFRVETEKLRWRESDRDLAAWCAGRTGYPIVDAGMRELAETGWMHNRVRMIVAMFLTKQLLLDWRLGERYFMRHLVDGDLASNNGGWQWSASTGTDAAPYFRIFNPFLQSRRFDADGAYIRRYVPELRSVPAAALHDPDALSEYDRSRLNYPPPICDHAAARNRAIAAFQSLRTGSARRR
jgi:deoxyribodipyrimidine photo-lyase